jgi:hypothetical protein
MNNFMKDIITIAFCNTLWIILFAPVTFPAIYNFTINLITNI